MTIQELIITLLNYPMDTEVKVVAEEPYEDGGFESIEQDLVEPYYDSLENKIYF